MRVTLAEKHNWMKFKTTEIKMTPHFNVCGEKIENWPGFLTLTKIQTNNLAC